MQPDPGEHIPLIYRVINQMGLKGDIADEAFSEGLVILTKASQSFDSSKNIPVANWLAMKIRWSLKKWLWQYRRPITYIGNYYQYIETIDFKVELDETLEIAKTILTNEEYLCLIGEALGLKGYEIAKQIQKSNAQVTRIKQRAIRKITSEYAEEKA